MGSIINSRAKRVTSVSIYLFIFINRRLTIERLEIDTLEKSWLEILYPELTKTYFLNLKRFLAQEKKNKQVVFPPEADIYSWSHLTPYSKVKVVILGQDPYHNVNQAHGLAFSVKPPTPAPPSLKNMYIALTNDYPQFKKPPHNGGYLVKWAKQGVLMLNTCLTVRAHNANSHANKGWETFTEKVLAAIARGSIDGKITVNVHPVCFLAWGNPAGKRMDMIKPDPTIHKVLRTVHPSPLSASRGFFSAGHFRKANEFLEEKYGPGGIINWALTNDNKIDEIEEKLALGNTQKQEKEAKKEENKKDEKTKDESENVSKEQDEEELLNKTKENILSESEFNKNKLDSLIPARNRIVEPIKSTDITEEDKNNGPPRVLTELTNVNESNPSSNN